MSDEESENKGFTHAEPDSDRESALPIDFSTFVLSLSTSALYQMGLVAGPDGAPREEPDRLLARQAIDTLKMLRTKTEGNLDEAELKLIDSLLYELHSRFASL